MLDEHDHEQGGSCIFGKDAPNINNTSMNVAELGKIQGRGGGRVKKCEMMVRNFSHRLQPPCAPHFFFQQLNRHPTPTNTRSTAIDPNCNSRLDSDRTRSRTSSRVEADGWMELRALFYSTSCTSPELVNCKPDKDTAKTTLREVSHSQKMKSSVLFLTGQKKIDRSRYFILQNCVSARHENLTGATKLHCYNCLLKMKEQEYAVSIIVA